jgi:hypothetical protein
MVPPLARATGAPTGVDGIVKLFEGLFGDATASTTLSDEDMRRVAMRAERRARYGREPAGVTERRRRAADQAELARQISEALHARDVVSARALIADGAALYGHSALLAAVEVQASQDQTEAINAVRREAEPGDQWADDPEPHAIDDWGLDDEPR